MSGPQSVLRITCGHWPVAILTKVFLVPSLNQFFSNTKGLEARLPYWYCTFQYTSLWNSLAAALWRPDITLHTFKRQLNAYLFHI